MIMKRIFLTLAAAAMAAAATAQQIKTDMGGLLMDKDILMPGDLFDLSQTQFNFGTARSMAMAGAFTSLGADLSSMAINPAGLGMYRRGEIALTPMMTFARAKNNAPSYGSNARNRFAMANIGTVINAYESTRGLVSLNIGLGYNRIADFNYAYSTQRQGQQGSVADALARQLVWNGVSKNDFYNNNGSGDWNWNNIPLMYQNAALAYRAFMIDQTDAADPSTWQPTWIGPTADIGHYSTVRSKGSVGEYSFAVGMNIDNRFYIGATIGLQSIYQRKYIDYAEDYVYGQPSPKHEFGVDPSLDYQLLYAKLNQTTSVEGTGVNFKLGMVYRPTDNLRLGVAIHTPTYYSLTYKFQSAAAGMAYANNDTDPNVTPSDGYISTAGDPNVTAPTYIYEGPDSWSFVTPTRLMVGASYMFGQRGVISVDYERDWYNGIRIKDNPSGLDSQTWYNDTFRRQCKGANILRVGAEFKLLPTVALRAGYGYAGSMLRDRETVFSSPVVKQTSYFGAGAGFMLGRNVSLDVAYQYMSSKLTDYYLFYAWESVDGVEQSVDSARYSTEINRHNVAVTLGFRF